VLSQYPEIVVANGQLVADGGPRHRLTRADARKILADAARDPVTAADRRVCDTTLLYGCHFAVRRAVFRSVSFDERLPFYGWLEDIDFGRSCEKLGRVCCINGARMVHLAERSGRTSGLRFGFSQIMNPAYMRTKGTFATAECLNLWCRALASNVAGLVFLSRPKRERLCGNLMALLHLLRGKVDPEYITRL
jgi:GT2 family glycosyltransferase